MFKELELSKAVLRQFLSVMTEAEVHRRIHDYWTIAEHLSHLVESQSITLRRIGIILAEDTPRLVPFTPDGSALQKRQETTEELLDTFCRTRDDQLRLLKRAKAIDWAKTVTHPEYTKYSLEILVRHTLLHDHFHMARMEQLWIMKEEYILPLDSN